MKTEYWILLGAGAYWLYSKNSNDWVPINVDGSGHTFYFSPSRNSYQDANGKPVDKDGNPL